MSVLSELLEKRDKRQRQLDELVATLHVKDEKSGEESDRDLTPEEEQRSRDLLEKRDKLDARIKEENDKKATQILLAEARRNAGVNVETRADGQGADVSVENEPKVYGHGSRNSYFADIYYTAGGFGHDPLAPQYQSAMARRMEWSNQVEHEIADGSKFGRFAETQFREHYRSPQGDKGGPGGGPDWREFVKEARSRGRVGLSDKGMPSGVESRALSTGGGATASAAGGGIAAFVTPIFTEGDYVPFREFGRAFADETTKRPVPDYGELALTP